MEILNLVVKNIVKLAVTIGIIVAVVFGAITAYNWAFADKDPVATEQSFEKKNGKIIVDTVVAYLAKNDPIKSSKPTENSKTISKTGTILAGQEVAVSPEISGNIKQLLVKEGSLVKKGQVLATLENSSQLKNTVVSYNSALALLRNAETLLNITAASGQVSLSTYNEQFASAQLNVEKAAIQLDSTRVIRFEQQDLADINQATQTLQQELTSSTANTGTTSQNQNTQSGSTQTYNAAIDGLPSIESDYYQEYLQDAVSKNQQVSQVKTRELENLQGEVQDDMNYLGVEAAQIQLSLLAKQMQGTELQNQASIVNAQNQIIQIRQQLESAKVGLSQGEIRSPINGVVTNLTITAGSKVNPGEMMFRVTNFDEINIKLFLSPNELFELVGRSNLNVNVELMGQTVPATINYFGMVANPQTRTIPVEVSPRFSSEAQKSRFIPNTFAKVMFEFKNRTAVAENVATERNDDFRLPITALLKQDSSFKVAVVSDEVVAFKAVELAPGIKAGKAAIKSGITDGEVVILNPANLNEGDKVTTK
jgi:multidrug efflux pump subunit AcrA (membrane-fusion protein)